jgi:hypothetical protein
MRRIAVAAVAAGLAGAALPIVPAQAALGGGGYATTATATPLKIEVYEPTIPIPAEPQVELSLAYTKTDAATGPTTDGRASWLWPGDSVGEGFKTFVEQLGLPKQLGQRGYPVQTNSQSPGGPQHQSDEPVPGGVEHTSSSGGGSVAMAGYSPDGDVSQSGGGGKGGGKPGLPSLPTPPGAPSQPGAAGPPSGPALPRQLSALVDASGVASVSRSTGHGGVARSVATSRLHDLSLLGGLVTADSVTVTTAATSDGQHATTTATSHVVGLKVAGTPVTVDSNGVSAAGKRQAIPGLPNDPAKALKQLGISFKLPQGQRRVTGANGTATMQGLQIVVDTGPLHSKLAPLQLDKIVNQVPNQAGELKSVLGALVNLSPKFVILTGTASAGVNTVPAIALPSISAGSLTGASGSATAGTGAVGGLSGAGSAGSLGAGAPMASVPGGAAPGTAAIAPQSATPGLPPLGTVPGALMAGGIVLASALGWWLRRIGGFVIGGAGSCSHGLETGVPDLRKA